MQEIMQRNALETDNVVSCIFTATRDLDAEFPAVAARTSALIACRCCARRRSQCRSRCRGWSGC